MTSSSTDLDAVDGELADTSNRIETANNRIESIKRRIEALKRAAEQLRLNATNIRELDVGGKIDLLMLNCEPMLICDTF